MPSAQGNAGSNVKLDDQLNVKEPSQYNVIIHNDNFTEMGFVVVVLMTIFNKQQDDAVSLMLKVHRTGSAVAGTYTYDIAMSKIDRATALARANDYPLRLSCQKA